MKKSTDKYEASLKIYRDLENSIDTAGGRENHDRWKIETPKYTTGDHFSEYRFTKIRNREIITSIWK